MSRATRPRFAHRPGWVWLAVAGIFAAFPLLTACGFAPWNAPVKVGLLNSLTGSSAGSERALGEAARLAIDEINASGGVLRRQIGPVVQDGASDPEVFADKAKQLIERDDAVSIFGCWTSAGRREIVPVLQSLNGLLWCPVPSEGFEASPNIFYTGPSANQQVVPAIEYLLRQGKTRFFLLGSDSSFPRVTNIIIQAQIAASPAARVVGEEYSTADATDYGEIVERLRSSDADVLVSTLLGDTNRALAQALRSSGLGPDRLTTLSLRIGEEETRQMGPDLFAGQLVASGYFQTTDSERNRKFVSAFQARYGADRVTDDSIEAAYASVYLWKAAVEKAGSFEAAKVRAAAGGLTAETPAGPVHIADNHYLSRPARVGRFRPDGQIDEVWSSDAPIEPDPFLTRYPWASAIRPAGANSAR